MLVKIVWPDLWFHFFNNYSSSMYAYTIEDFGSSRFTECISITIHRTVFSALLFTDTKNGQSELHENKLAPCPLFFFYESTVYLFTSCLWSPGFVWPDTCAKYWITFLVFSVFPAPDSPLKPKWKHCLRLFWGTNRGMTLIKRLKLTSGMKYQLKLFCLFSSLLGSCWSKIHWLVKPDYP